MRPRISVITVCYNCVDTIERTIKSVLSQSYPNIEYIVIDGSSNDGTVDIIHKYEQSIAFWVSEPDGGIYEAMNKGIDAATGDIIGFINGDDYYGDNVIGLIAEKYSDTNADVIYGNLTFIDDNGTQNDWKAPENLHDFYCGMMIPHPSTFCKTSLLKRYKMDTGYRIASDYKLLLQLYHDKMKFVHVDKVVAFFYIGGVSGCKLFRTAKETHDISIDVIRDNPILREKYLNRIEKIYKDKIIDLVSARACKYGYTHQWVKDNFCEDEKVYIFGAGERAADVYEFLLSAGKKINGFLDNDVKRHGGQWRDIVVYSPDILFMLSKGIIIVSTVKYEKEIINQLEKMKLGKNFTVYTYQQLKQKVCEDYLHDRRLLCGCK